MEVAIAWALRQSNRTFVIVGAHGPGQLRKDLGAMTVELSSETLAEMDVATH